MFFFLIIFLHVVFWCEICINLSISVDKMSWMIGSKGPQSELQTYVTPAEESPKGFMKRGVYKVKSHVIDDDRNAIFDWEWNLAVNKYW